MPVRTITLDYLIYALAIHVIDEVRVNLCYRDWRLDKRRIRWNTNGTNALRAGGAAIAPTAREPATVVSATDARERGDARTAKDQAENRSSQAVEGWAEPNRNEESFIEVADSCHVRCSRFCEPVLVDLPELGLRVACSKVMVSKGAHMNRRTLLKSLAGTSFLGISAGPAAQGGVPKMKITPIRVYSPPNPNPLFNKSVLVTTIEVDIRITRIVEA